MNEIEQCSILRAGNLYKKLLLNENIKLYFPLDARILKLLILLTKWIPAFIAFALIWQFSLHGNWISTIVSILFSLSLPFQCLLWLGFRAKLSLPLSYLSNFNKMQKTLNLEKIKPNYYYFTYLFNQIEKKNEKNEIIE